MTEVQSIINQIISGTPYEYPATLRKGNYKISHLNHGNGVFVLSNDFNQQKEVLTKKVTETILTNVLSGE